MLPIRTLALATFALLGALPATAHAQKAYENKNHGFSVKPPKDWRAIPPEPGEKYMVVKYTSEKKQSSRSGSYYKPELTIEVFKQRSVTGEDEEKIDGLPDDLPEEIKRQIRAQGLGGSWQTFAQKYADRFADEEVVKKPKERKINKIKVTEYNFLQPLTTSNAHTRTYVFHGDAMEVALTYKGLEDRFKDVDKLFERSARTFKWIEREVTSAESTENLSEEERYLKAAIDSLPPGWQSMESYRKRYMFLFDADEDFVKELDRQLEAMRDYYETVFPPEKEITAVSIVRVCADESTYHAYGGRPGTGGYWAASKRELVIYDDKNYDRNLTRQVINHEAFHQYIYYFYGELAPHSWYNEGHGDYFAGAELSKSMKRVVKIKPLNSSALQRHSRIKQAVREGAHIPLKEFMNWSQQQYYSYNYGYPQGWSIVYFLRGGRKVGANVKPKWVKMLDEYLVNLVAARDKLAADGVPKFSMQSKAQKLAYETTFEDWTDDDWNAFQKSWESYYGG